MIGRPKKKELKKRIAKLSRVGYNYSEIANLVGLKNKQAVYYHIKVEPLVKVKL